MHGCDVLNEKGFARPYVLSEHTLVVEVIHVVPGCATGEEVLVGITDHKI